jgi:hypothetical protein
MTEKLKEHLLVLLLKIINIAVVTFSKNCPNICIKDIREISEK